MSRTTWRALNRVVHCVQLLHKGVIVVWVLQASWLHVLTSLLHSTLELH
jgi:hypothetical protein